MGSKGNNTNIGFLIKQGIKMCLQGAILPIVYQLCKSKKIDPDLVLFADAHHDELPDAMEEMYHQVVKSGKTVRLHFLDFGKASGRVLVRAILDFMKDYGRASAVFICDYYLPANSCRRRKETQVIQLWHACGGLKKFGMDAGDDIPGFYKGNPLKNVTLVTVSSPWCIPIYAGAMGLPERCIKALGVSRTDRYYREDFNHNCKVQFYNQYPQLADKKLILWAPTFRDNASNPKLIGGETIDRIQEQLGDDWYIIKKLHPHLEGKAGRSNCTIKTEELLPVCHIMITDYSSILFDYMIYRKPLILFAPDVDAYNTERGMYIDYNEIPGIHVRKEEELLSAVKEAACHSDDSRSFFDRYMGSCDGNSTSRIYEEVFHDAYEKV